MKASDKEWVREIIGRELDASEWATFETVETISPTVAAVTTSLAAKYRVLACKYLKDRVPGADFEEVKPRSLRSIGRGTQPERGMGERPPVNRSPAFLASKYLREHVAGLRFSMVKAKVEQIMDRDQIRNE